MLNIKRAIFEDTPLHSHSDLTRQLEELEAHAQALRFADDASDFILDDLVVFAEQFADDMRAHIIEEEEEFFPHFLDKLSIEEQSLLDELHTQHQEIERSLQVFLDYLEQAQNQEGMESPDLVEAIFVRARLLRYTVTIHSMKEEEFFATQIN